MDVKPFRGIRPRADLADKIPSHPYDVVSSDEARTLAADDPHSFLHVVRAEIDLDPSVAADDPRVYDQAHRNLASMLERGWLVRDDEAAFYVYALRMDDHVQYGLVGASAVSDYVEGRIKRHEHTRPEKEDDRVRLNEALGVHPGPVMLTYRALPEINALVRGVVAEPARVDFVAPDGVGHALWVVDDEAVRDKIGSLFSRVRHTYVADGHHRAAAAARVSTRRAETAGAAAPGAAWNYFLTVLFPSDQLRVMDYNRVVRDLNGLTPAEFLQRLEGAGFGIEAEHRAKRPPHRRTFGMYVDGRWYLLSAPEAALEAPDPAGRLDVAILHRALLEPVLGIGDVRTDQRIDFVGGIRGMRELEAWVDGGRAEVAFAMYPTRIDDVMEVADAGLVMPPKSTWFEPKLRSGMVVQRFDDDTL